VADMGVAIDERGNNCLTRQLDSGRTRRGLDLTAASHACEPPVLNKECCVLNRPVAAAHDEAPTLEKSGARSGGLLCACLCKPDAGEKAGDADSRVAHRMR